MSKDFFYSIAFKNVSGGNILQNGIVVKLVLHHAKTYGCEFWGWGKKSRATTANKDWNMVAKDKKNRCPQKIDQKLAF